MQENRNQAETENFGNQLELKEDQKVTALKVSH